MSPEKQPKGLGNNKQKIMIGVLVVIVLIVIWQFMGLGGGSEEAIQPTPAPKASPASPGAQGMTSTSPASPAATAGGAGISAAPVSISQPKPAPIPASNELLKMQQQNQLEYIASINKLQMLKLQREIDETKTAIATAELNRMTAEKNIADLITTKPQVIPETLTETTEVRTGEVPPPPITQAPVQVMPPPIPDYPYQLLSVAYQGRKWSAVISAQGKLLNVTVGDTLPNDNSKVISISKKGITLHRNNTTRTISITSMM